MDPIVTIAELASRTGAVVTLTASPWVGDRTLVQWIVSVAVAGTVCLGSSTSIETAFAECSAQVDRALGVIEYPQSKEG
jgi:hypothetical protein